MMLVASGLVGWNNGSFNFLVIHGYGFNALGNPFWVAYSNKVSRSSKNSFY